MKKASTLYGSLARGVNSKTKLPRVVFLVCDTSS